VVPVSRPPIEDGAVLVRGGRILAVGRWQELRHETAGSVQDLGDSLFLTNHCFYYGGPSVVDGDSAVRIDFQPSESIAGPDVGGAIYFDVQRGLARRAMFFLTHGHVALSPIDSLTVTTAFREIAPNVQVFDRVDAERWTRAGGGVRAIETDRLLSYRFLQGAPGS